MTSTRRITSLLAVAAAFTCLGGASAAQAATSPLGPPINPVAELDALATTGLPAESRAQYPGIAGQLNGLNGLHDLGQLRQLTDQAAPVTGLLPEIS
ncbi:hypothetical protein ACIRQY_01760 [Streptomyces sp. NPDC101490]|uniref:hypothetical protein n=1 Tax=unclassified Streptomyces TaxID=2593676 RepID=UPI00331E0A8F